MEEVPSVTTFNNLLPKLLLPVPKNLNSSYSEILVPKRVYAIRIKCFKGSQLAPTTV